LTEDPVTLDEMREIVLGFPGAVEGASYGQPSFLVNTTSARC